MGESVPCMIDADAQVGSIVSIDNIDVGDRVNVNGSLYAPSLSFGNNVIVSGNHIIDESIRMPRETNFQVVFPPAAITSVWTEPGSVKSLSPGRYGVVRIAPNSTLHMKSGAYYFEQLNLEDSSHLVLNDSNGPIFVYAKSVTSIRCTIENERGTVPEWLLFYTGEQELNLERSFHGTLLAPKASVILHAAHHIGSFYAHALKIEANAKITHMPGLPMLIAADMDLHECMASIPENTGQDMLAQTVLFQEEIVNYCLAPDMNKCLSSLIAKGRAERGAAVIGFIGQSRTFAEYFALAEHRFESVQMAEKNALYAAKLCAFPDSDGDWVIDAEDLCPGTPELTAVDSNGCPKAVVQESPEDEQMYRDHLGEFNFIFNERCKGIEPPGVVAPGGFFWVSQQNVVYLISSKVPNQKPECPFFYQWEIQGETFDGYPAHLFMQFKDSESVPDLIGMGKTVPSGMIQFRVTESDDGDRSKLSNDLKPYKGTFRVRAVSALGVPGPWTDWRHQDQYDCFSLGFSCQ